MWNVFNSNYRNRNTRASFLEAISQYMNIENFMAKDVAKKVRSLQTTYHMEKTKIQASKSSGASSDSVYKCPLSWYKSMDYIMKTSSTKDKITFNNMVSLNII